MSKNWSAYTDDDWTNPPSKEVPKKMVVSSKEEAAKLFNTVQSYEPIRQEKPKFKLLVKGPGASSQNQSGQTGADSIENTKKPIDREQYEAIRKKIFEEEG